MRMRNCEKCHGPGPALWSNNTQLYLCVQCHEDPTDDFFIVKEDEEEIEDSPMTLDGIVGWKSGVNDAIKIVTDRRKFLWSMGPRDDALRVLDEILIQLIAMRNRGCFEDTRKESSE